MLLDYLFQMVRGKDYVLALDDFHLVEDDPLLSDFIERLQAAVGAGEVEVIIAAQRRPDFATESAVEPLSGMSQADVGAWAAGQQIDLTPDQLTELQNKTGGNAALLMLALDALHREKNPARMLKRLGESQRIERFLVKEVDDSLSMEEREVMKAAAILQGYPGSRDALSAILDGQSVWRTLNDLCGRYLLSVIEGEAGREYAQHILIQEFYYDLLSKSERQAMHRRAAEYYSDDEPDALKAARHFYAAGFPTGSWMPANFEGSPDTVGFPLGQSGHMRRFGLAHEHPRMSSALSPQERRLPHTALILVTPDTMTNAPVRQWRSSQKKICLNRSTSQCALQLTTSTACGRADFPKGSGAL